MNRKTLLILTQVYPPDPASVGQHMADVAERMVQRNWDVIVLTSNRGYDDYKEKYETFELLNGVQVSRFSLTSFGKSNILLRVMSQISLLLKTLFKSLAIKRPDAILISTNLVFIVAPLLKLLRKIPYIYWVMDLNPDQAIEAGVLRPNSLSVKLYNFFQYLVLGNADVVVSLDRFISKRVSNKNKKILNHQILPPWPHEDHLFVDRGNKNTFKEENHWGNKRIFMYSGNHSLVHPLDTFLAAIKEFEDEEDFLMAFIGGGLGKHLVEEWIIDNPKTPVTSLPYQPLNNLHQSLSAADIHLVSMGNQMIGCVHPCKIYSAMAIGKPILLLGNLDNHITEILEEYDVGWSVNHGDIDTMVKTLTYLRDVDKKILIEKGRNAKEAIESKFSQQALLGDFCYFIEQTQNK